MMSEQDKQRREEFKSHEMEKEHERREKRKSMNDEEKKKEEDEWKTHHNQKHEKLHEPVSKENANSEWNAFVLFSSLGLVFVWAYEKMLANEVARNPKQNLNLYMGENILIQTLRLKLRIEILVCQKIVWFCDVTVK